MEQGLENLKENLDEAFNIDAVNRRLEKRQKEQEAQQQADASQAQPNGVFIPLPIDLYKHNNNKRVRNERKTYPNGSSTLVNEVVKAIINGDGGPGGLARARRRAKGDIETFRRRGEDERAEIMARQYMEESFLPAIEVVIRYTSPDELLNNKEALKSLDKMALGTGRMDGYTASYIREAYGAQLGQDLESRFGGSDANVADAVRRIKDLSYTGDVRVAVGIARRIKKQIDEGRAMASDDDYDVIGRVVAYAD